METRVVPLRCEQVFACVDRDLRTSGSDLLRWATVRREDLHFTGKPNSPSGRWTLRRNFISGPEGHLLQASAAEKAHALNGTQVNYHKIALEVVGIILPTWQGQIQMWCPKRALLTSSEWKEILITCICPKNHEKRWSRKWGMTYCLLKKRSLLLVVGVTAFPPPAQDQCSISVMN